MVNQETKNDYAIVGMVIALIAGITGLIVLISEVSVMPVKIADLIVNSTNTNGTNVTAPVTTPIIVLPLNNTVVIDNNITNQTTVQNNTSTDTETDIVVVVNNQTQTSNSTKPLPEPVKDYFTTVCNIAPSADVCIAPFDTTNDPITP